MILDIDEIKLRKGKDMRFWCGLTERGKKVSREDWHMWYTWHPVWVSHSDTTGCWHWLEYVQRKGTCHAGYDYRYWTWEYRSWTH